MKTKLTATLVTGILLLGAAAGLAADRSQTRSRTQMPTSTCTPGTGSMTRTCGGK